jgi:tetratricopeptide (TPR) repeat protein
MTFRSPALRDDFVVLVASMVAYVLTLAPTVTTGDSGELITAATTLGLAHPTGYPLYILSGRIFLTLFFFLPPALAMNLFSAACASAAAIVVRRLVARITADRFAALATALLFAFSASLWSQATTARVYCLNVLLVSLVLLETERIFRAAGGRPWLAWLWLGLGMANHTVSVILLPVVVWATVRADLPWSRRLASVALVLPGLALYLYVPIAASFQPYQNWGDPSSWDRLLDYLARKDYWDRRYVEGAGDVARVFGLYFGRIPSEIGWIGAGLAGLGLVAGLSRERRVAGMALYLLAANAGLMCLHGSRSDIFYWPRYLLAGWLGVSLLAGLGLAQVVAWVRFRPLAASLALLAPALALVSNWRENDRSGNTLARDFSARILERVEPNAQVFAEGDNVLFPLIYLHHVEGVRPDVTLVLQGINVLSQRQIDPDREPIYFTHHHDLGAPQLELVPSGLVYRLVRKEGTPPKESWASWAIPSFDAVTEPGRLRYLDRNLVGDYLLLKAVNLEKPAREAALEAARLSMAVDFDNVRSFLNSGLLLERNLHFEEALAAFRHAAGIDDRDRLAAERTAFWTSVLDRAGRGRGGEERASRLAGALLDSGRPGLAAGVLREALVAWPKSFTLHYNLAAVLLGMRAFEPALRELEAALELKPDDAIARRDWEKVTAILEKRN